MHISAGVIKFAIFDYIVSRYFKSQAYNKEITSKKVKQNSKNVRNN